MGADRLLVGLFRRVGDSQPRSRLRRFPALPHTDAVHAWLDSGRVFVGGALVNIEYEPQCLNAAVSVAMSGIHLTLRRADASAFLWPRNRNRTIDSK